MVRKDSKTQHGGDSFGTRTCGNGNIGPPWILATLERERTDNKEKERRRVYVYFLSKVQYFHVYDIWCIKLMYRSLIGGCK